jgi:dCTP deaminase
MLSKIREWFLHLIHRPTILSYDELVQLVLDGVIDAPLENINGSSIDVTLHHIVQVEDFGPKIDVIRLYKKENIKTREIDMFKTNNEHIVYPDHICLAATNETLNMPLNLSAKFLLKSSTGRNYFSHQLAGWVDPGFHGVLTLEFKNETQFHKLAIAPNMKVGQIVFYRHRPVPHGNSYKVKGQYNGQTKATGSKGIR